MSEMQYFALGSPDGMTLRHIEVWLRVSEAKITKDRYDAESVRGLSKRCATCGSLVCECSSETLFVRHIRAYGPCVNWLSST